MATQAEISQLYQSVLGRAPDPEGLAYWQSTGQSAEQIAQAIAASPEAQIVSTYQSALGRAPDEAGLAYWQQQASTPQGLLSAISGISGSNEALERGGVAGLYQSMLGRAPEAGGLEYWQQQLASGKSIQEVKEAIRLSAENTIPGRPTFDDVFSRWNETHKKQFGTYLNLATATEKEVQAQIDRLIVDTKKEQADWDKTYGQTQEGRLIANNPPPNWYDIYNEWATNEYKPRFGTDTLNRAWNADADSVRQKEELDQRYLAALSEYNQRNGTNIQPDVGVLGAGAQPNAFYKEPEKAQKSFLQKVAPYAGLALAVAFPGAGTALGSAIGMGSGLAGAVAGNAIIGGTISGLAGQNIGQGALLGGLGGALSQVNWGAVSDSLAGTFADITGIDSAVIKSALSQPASNAAFAAEDALSMAQGGLGTAAIQQNLIASGMDSLTAATLANSAVMPGATAQSLLGSIANQPIYTNIGGLLSGGNAFATTKNVFDNLVAGGMSAADATKIINTAGGGLDLGTVGLDAAGNLIQTAVGGAGSLLGGMGSAGGAAAAAGGAASTIGKTAAGILGGTAGQIGSGLLSSAVGIGGAMADRAALERYAQQIKDAANQYAPQQQFQPVGVTTRFGRTTTPQYDAQGRLTSIGVRGAEDVTAQQNRLLSLSGQALPTTTNIDQATQDYYNQLQAVQRPTDELNLAQIQSRLQATGRGGLAFGATSGAGGSNALMATNPELAAYYNALAQRQSTQALSAQDVAQQRLNAQIATSGTLFGQAKSIEEMIQQPLQLSSQFGQQATAGSTNVARSQLEANALAARLQSQGALGVNAAATGGAAGLAPGLGNILGTAIGNLF